MAVTAKAKRLKASGADIISFGAGEPDFDTPQRIKDAAAKAMADGFTKYTPAGGIDELKDAVVIKFRYGNGLEYTRDQIIISCGAKHSLYNVCQVLLEKDDELLIPRPYWVSYPEFAHLAEATPVYCSLDQENGFDLDIEALKGMISDKTRAVVINSPSNPTGGIYSPERLKAVVDLAIKYDFWIISDEVYEHLVYDGQKHFSIASISDQARERTIVVNGVSKAYSMTGWRIGYLAAPKEIAKAVSSLQSHSTSNPTSIAQMAALEALRGSQDELYAWRQEFERRRNLIFERLVLMPGVDCPLPGGAFYVMPSFEKVMGARFQGKEISNTLELADYFLTECKIACVPGEGFGAPGYLRFSFALSQEGIEKGMDRLEEGLGRLK